MSANSTLRPAGGYTTATDMKLALVSIEKDGVIRVATDGNITAGDFSPEGKNPLEGLLGLTWNTTRVMLDMGQTAYIDSSAIGWLIGTSRAFRDAGGSFVIHSVQPAVRQLTPIPTSASSSRSWAVTNKQ